MMAITFDTLAYSKQLQAAGIPAPQADAQARAQAEQIIKPLWDKVATKDHVEAVINRAEKSILDKVATKEYVDLKIAGLSGQITIRMGVMIMAGFTLFFALLKLFPLQFIAS